MKDRFLQLEKPRLPHHGFKRLIWRLFSVIGHIFFRKMPPDITTSGGKRFLNVGSGAVMLEGFVNADFYRLHHVLKSNSADWMIDLTKPLRCDNNYWDGVLIEHTNEHILYSENYDLLKELYRTMKPGAVIRIVAPDLNKYLSWETLRTSEPKMARYNSLPEAISNLTQNHLHLSVWNFELMAELLEEIGFSHVKNQEFECSQVAEFSDSPNHEWQSFYIEATKPI